MKLGQALVVVAISAMWLVETSNAFSHVVFQWLIAIGALICVLTVFSEPGISPKGDFASAFRRGTIIAAALSAWIGFAQYIGCTDSPVCRLLDTSAGQIYAHLRQRNQLATLLTMGVLALICTLSDVSLPSSQRERVGRAFLLWTLALILFVLAATESRTGATQIVAIFIMAVVLHRQLSGHAIWLVFGVASVYLLSIALLPLLDIWFATSSKGIVARLSDANAFVRLQLWSNCLELIAQKPWLGHGWRSLAYAHYSSSFEGERFMEMLDNAHNLPLHLAVELGIPVALGFCGLVGWLIWKNKPWRETRPDRQLAWGILLVIGIHSMVEYPLWYGPFFMTALICISILCSDFWQNWLFAHTKSTLFAIKLGVKCGAAMLLAGFAFVAFDYHRVSQIYLQPEQRSSWYAHDPLGAAKKSVLFQNHAKFAELQITALSRETAPRVLQLSSDLVTWSPEPRIIEKLIESATMLQLDDIAAFHLLRYKIAYPRAYALWAGRPS